MKVSGLVDGGATDGGETSGGATNGGATDVVLSGALLGFAGGLTDLSPSMDDIDSLLSFLDLTSFSNPIDTKSLIEIEEDLIHSFFFFSDPQVFKAFSHPFSRPFDLSKPLSSYTEAVARPDAHVWHSAMDCEWKSLTDMKAFEEVELPKGEQFIGLKWVFNIKTDAAGA